MKSTKLEISPEEDVELLKQEPNQSELEDKSESEPKNREEKRREEKIVKRDVQRIETNKNKNGFLYYKNVSEKNSNYEGNKRNKKNKRDKINKKMNALIIITIIFFNLIIPNNNKMDINLQV